MVKEKYYAVYLPILSKNEVADIMAKEPKVLTGKGIKIDLASIARGRLGEIKGEIKEIKEGKAIAELRGIKLYPSYVKRFVRRGVTKLDESFIVETSDKKKVRIKPTFITRKRVHRGVQTALRKEVKSFLEKLISTYKTEELIQGIIRGEIQKTLSKKLKKVYPLSFCEIREVLILKKK